MACIYIVDDEPPIRRLAAIGLHDAGFETAEFSCGEELLRQMRQQRPDGVLLDWMLPGMDGLEVLAALREDPATRSIPVLMMTARTGEEDRIGGLEGGADDYITKPFSVRELAARVKAVLRRREYLSAERPAVLTGGGLELDPERRLVWRDGRRVSLTAREFDLLWTLMRSPGRVFTREMLLDVIWGESYCGDGRTVDVHIRYLRQKLEEEPELPRRILTVRGVGYRFADGAEAEIPANAGQEDAR